MGEETVGRRRPAYGLGGGFWLGGGELAAGPAGFGAGEHGGEEWGVVEVLVELLALFAVEDAGVDVGADGLGEAGEAEALADGGFFFVDGAGDLGLGEAEGDEAGVGFAFGDGGVAPLAE